MVLILDCSSEHYLHVWLFGFLNLMGLSTIALPNLKITQSGPLVVPNYSTQEVKTVFLQLAQSALATI